MRKIPALLCLFCLAACTRIYHTRTEIVKFVSQDAIFEKIAKKNSANIVLVIASENGGFRSAGTGFVVREDGYILTAAHAVREGTNKNTEVIIKEGDKIVTVKVKNPIANQKYDLALLKIDYRFKTAVRTKARIMKSGETVFTMGYADGLRNKFSHKTALKKSYGRFYIYSPEKNSEDGSDMKMQLHTTKVAQGASGSPVFDANGDVVGVVSKIKPKEFSNQVYDWAVPIRYYELFLKPLQN